MLQNQNFERVPVTGSSSLGLQVELGKVWLDWAAGGCVAGCDSASPG